MWILERSVSDSYNDSGASASLSMYEGLGSDSQTLINATFALTTIGQIALLLLGATLLFSHGPQARRATLVNVVIVTLFSTIPPYLLYAPHLL